VGLDAIEADSVVATEASLLDDVEGRRPGALGSGLRQGPLEVAGQRVQGGRITSLCAKASPAAVRFSGIAPRQ